MKASEFDERFDRGEDVTDELDLEESRRPVLEAKRVSVDFPLWVVESLDREAKRLGVTRPICHQGLDRGASRARVASLATIATLHGAKSMSTREPPSSCTLCSS